jgi:hypothetical protein
MSSRLLVEGAATGPKHRAKSGLVAAGDASKEAGFQGIHAVVALGEGTLAARGQDDAKGSASFGIHATSDETSTLEHADQFVRGLRTDERPPRELRRRHPRMPRQDTQRRVLNGRQVKGLHDRIDS